MVLLDPSHPLDKLILQRKGRSVSEPVDIELSSYEVAGLKRKCADCKAALAAPEPAPEPEPVVEEKAPRSAPKKKSAKKEAAE